MNRWLTPDTATGDITCRRFYIPSVLLPAFNGALDMLTIPEAWEQHGDMTPDEAAQAAWDVILQSHETQGCYMIGSIVAGIWEDLPANLLWCDGAEYNREDYPLLYAAIDSKYYTSPDTFEVPNLQSRVLIAVGEGEELEEYDLGDMGGEESVTLYTENLPSHSHSVMESGLNVDVEPPAGLPDAAGGLPVPSSTGSVGSDEPHENRQPYYAVYYAIVAR